jgi:hypothetical protein
MNQRKEVKIVRVGQKEWELAGHNRCVAGCHRKDVKFRERELSE